MPTLPVLTWLGNAVAVLLGKHGDVTQQARQAGCSRQVAYEHAERVHQAVADAQRPGPRRDGLLEENRRLQEEVVALRRQRQDAILLDQDKRQRLAVTTSAMGLSLSQIPVVSIILMDRDQGKGLLAGLKARAQARPDGASRLEVGLDVFHTEREARTVLARDWRKVEACWQRAEEADQALAKAKDLRGKAARAQAAWRRAQWAWSFYEGRAAAWERAKAALAVFRPDGRLNDRAGAQAEIAAACRSLPGPRWQKVRRALRDGRTLTFLDRLHRRLALAEPRPELREALVRLWRLERRPRTGVAGGAALVQRVVCAKLAADWAQAYARVSAVLGGVVRASSAVECVNSVL